MDDQLEEILPAQPVAPQGGGMSTVQLAAMALIVGVGGAMLLAGTLFGLMTYTDLLGPGGVPLLTRDIAAGGEIAADDIAYVSGPETPGVAEDLVARVAQVPMYAGDPVLEARLAPRGKRPGVASLTPKGHRALWLAVDAGIAGLGLQPGDRVDVYATSVDPNRDGYTQLVAEAILVLDVSPSAPLKPGKATLAVEPQVSADIATAQERGLLGLVLRSAVDVAEPLPEGALGEGGGAGAPRAATALAAGTSVGSAALVPAFDGAPGRAAQDVSELDGVVLRTILPGEHVGLAVLADAARGRGLSALLESGHHGVAVSLDGAPADTFAPGDVLDVVSVEGEEPEMLAEAAVVLGMQPEGADCPCVVLDLTERQVSGVLRARALQVLGFVVPEAEE